MRKVAYWCMAGMALTSHCSIGLAADESDNVTDWAKINSLTWQATGLTVRYPPLQDSLLGDMGGWRSDLAKYNIGIEPRIVMSGISDFNENDNKPKASYLGQGGDLMAATYSVDIVYGLADLGLPNSKLVLCLDSTNSSFEGNPQDKRAIGCLSYYQTFFDKKLELKAGFEPNLLTYVGLVTGGDATLTNTLGATIPVEAGMSDPLTTPPTANLTVHGDGGLYARGGVQRSVSPEGRAYETRHNGIGLDVSMDNAKDLYLGEVGIDRSSSADNHRLWVRAGGISNPTQYNAFEGGTDSNKAYWALGDYQLTQPSKGNPAQGLYIGGSVMYAPPDVNLFTQNYEARMYYYAPFKTRPLDRVTLLLGENKFSQNARDFLATHRVDTPANQLSATLAYAMHLMKGIYVSPAVGYTTHPSFTNDIDHAVTFKLSLLVDF